MDQEIEQRIRRKAYELWVADGKPEGSHLRFWKEAEREIMGEEEAARPVEILSIADRER